MTIIKIDVYPDPEYCDRSPRGVCKHWKYDMGNDCGVCRITRERLIQDEQNGHDTKHEWCKIAYREAGGT